MPGSLFVPEIQLWIKTWRSRHSSPAPAVILALHRSKKKKPATGKKQKKERENKQEEREKRKKRRKKKSKKKLASKIRGKTVSEAAIDSSAVEARKIPFGSRGAATIGVTYWLAARRESAWNTWPSGQAVFTGIVAVHRRFPKTRIVRWFTRADVYPLRGGGSRERERERERKREIAKIYKYFIERRSGSHVRFRADTR